MEHPQEREKRNMPNVSSLCARSPHVHYFFREHERDIAHERELWQQQQQQKQSPCVVSMMHACMAQQRTRVQQSRAVVVVVVFIFVVSPPPPLFCSWMIRNMCSTQHSTAPRAHEHSVVLHFHCETPSTYTIQAHIHTSTTTTTTTHTLSIL